MDLLDMKGNGVGECQLERSLVAKTLLVVEKPRFPIF